MAKRTRAVTSRSKAKRAGKPVTRAPLRAAARSARPSVADLDLRDRLKSGPRRQAGPPLVGDQPTRAAMAALRRARVPKATDPKNARSGR